MALFVKLETNARILMTAYFDANATQPLEPAAREAMFEAFEALYGNAGSRTHEFGLFAKRAVDRARAAVASVVAASPDEVIFTSGATESNNLAILGLAEHGRRSGKRHIVTTQIEHKAVLEPCQLLQREGFEVTFVPPGGGGRVSTTNVAGALRPDTLLVSIMHVNNETGVIQPVDEVADAASERGAFVHVDAAQGFGKELRELQSPGIHLISVSSHKIFGPKGVGALITRKRGGRVPLQPIMFGGGQERGLRPGTLPVPLIVGFGAAATAALTDASIRRSKCSEIRNRLIAALEPLGAEYNGSPEHTIASTLNVSIPNIDSEAAMISLKGIVAISNGSACTSSSYEPSHVLRAMGLADDRIANALRFSWSHLTEEPDWRAVTERLGSLMR